LLTKTVANTIRGLAADIVEQAKSGHPGMPLSSADLAAVLYAEVLKHDPTAPEWPDRDRFVLSAGHGSALLYALLHLTGYDLPITDLKRFRQLGSRAPGHPEYGVTPGVETTTGPLGQGIANAVGMALAEKMLAARFNRPGYEVVDHYTYTISGDGCLMEGVSAEASSLAGDLGLGKLILLYDANDITIEGSTDLAFKEDVAGRYSAYGWQVLKINGHDYEQILKALEEAKAETSKPTIIIAKTIMAKGCAALEGSHKAHGAPLGKENIDTMKKNLNLPEADFAVSDQVYAYFAEKRREWEKTHRAWEDKFKAWSDRFPELRGEWDRIMHGQLPAGLEQALPKFENGSSAATRDVGGKTLNALAEHLPELIGGSADLAPSTKTYINNAADLAAGEFHGRNLHFGIREHAMGSVMNGISLHGGFKVFGSTFLVFSDYMRPPIRLAALMKQPVIYVFTHDSFYVGEDGPTHEPIEHVESLRNIPDLKTIRPGDPKETVWAWLEAVKRTHGPTALILTRQKLPTLAGTTLEGFKRGGYIIQEAEGGKPDLIILAAGSEVSLALAAAELLVAEGRKARVVSVPCRETFLEQEAEYIQNVLGENIPRIAIEAGIGSGWYRLVGSLGLVISMERFGESGPADLLAEEFGFTPQTVAERIKRFIAT